MALGKKVLSGIGKVGKALTTENTVELGGLSAYLVPRRLNAAGVTLALGGMAGVSIGKEGIKSRNINKMGDITYSSGLARMTNSFTTGAPEAMYRVSGGNYNVFSDLAEEVVTDQSIGGKLENYGVTPQFVSALYNMGGR